MPEHDGNPMSALRAVGGMLLAAGAIVVLARRGTGHHPWSDFELLLTVVVPTAVLFALAIIGRSGRTAGPADPARAVLMVSAVLLSPLALFQFLVWAGVGTHHQLPDAAVLAVTAAIAIAGARRAGTPYAVFLAGLSLLGAWTLVLLKILHPASADDVRWTLLSGGAVLTLGAGAMSLADVAGRAEIATAGGLGMVVAGLQGILVGAVGGFFSEGLLGAAHVPGGQTTGWDVYLLVVSLAFSWGGARARLRGPSYVGAFGLLVFVIGVATQAARVQAGHTPSHSLLGWPLVLVLLGIAGLLAPFARRRSAN